MPPVTGQNLNIIAGTNAATCTDQSVCINVLANNFTSLQDLQFSVNWDPSIMEFVSVTNNDGALDPGLGVVYGQTEVLDGVLNFNWSDVEGDGHTLANGMRLFTLCFRPLSNGVGAITFTANNTPIEATRFIDENNIEPVEPEFIIGNILSLIHI